MAPHIYFSFRQVLVLYLVLFLFSSSLLCTSSDTQQFHDRRIMLEIEENDQVILPKRKSTNLSTNNPTKLIKSTKNQTKLIESTLSTKNSTKLTKSTNPTKLTLTTLPKTELKKLNSTSKAYNSTITSSAFKKETSDLLKLASSTNKTSKPTSSSTTIADKKLIDPESQKPKNNQKERKTIQKKTTQVKKQPSWLEQEDENDLVAEFRDLPTKFQQNLLPDLEKISTTSKKYLTKANKEMTRGFKPIVGNKYAPTIASIVSFAFISIPLLLVSLIFNRIKAYFSLQKILIFIQVYLSIYFSILCLSALVTGLEPLKFFYATSQSTYVCLMVLQTVGYVLYLLLLLMYLVLVFSTDSGMGSKMLGLAQTLVGLGVGLHYYVAVFHRVVLHQPPKTNWKVHGICATCFLAICLRARADRRKKAYLDDGGEEGKKN